jgi:membrane protein DedA with SNARE-associated domain
MDQVTQFLIQHGYVVLFLWVLAEQAGLPVPAGPLLLAAGALAGHGHLNLAIAFVLGVIASLLSDFLWYQIGRHRGSPVLQLLCRISLDPDSCVNRTKNLFTRHGAHSLLIAKFVPGLNTAAPPLAGIFRMHPASFLLFDGVGAALWVGAYVGPGYLFRDKIEAIANYAEQLGGSALGVLGAVTVALVGWKYVNRRLFLRRLIQDRITPEELKDKLDAGEDLTILDVRHPLDLREQPHRIPGALHFPLEELDQNHHKVPRNREIVLYCT